MSTNGSTSLGVRTLTTAGLVAVVAALVLGILGMHGLGQHGPMSHRDQPVTAVVSVDPHAAHPAPDHTPVAIDTSRTHATSTSGFGTSPDDHGSVGDMVMLCVAMLLAAVAGVLLTLRIVRFAHHAPLSLRPLFRVPTFPATARAGTGPPAVWEFCVVRC
jgi:hypothetical protein